MGSTIESAGRTPAQSASWRSPRRLLVIGLTLLAGIAIAWVDTRPNWDDAGVTAGAVLIASAAGAWAGVPPWLAALLTVGPMLLVELPGGAGVWLAAPFALAGAFAGGFIRRGMLAR